MIFEVLYQFPYLHPRQQLPVLVGVDVIAYAVVSVFQGKTKRRTSLQRQTITWWLRQITATAPISLLAKGRNRIDSLSNVLPSHKYS